MVPVRAALGAAAAFVAFGACTPVAKAPAMTSAPQSLPEPAVQPGVRLPLLSPQPEPEAVASDSAGIARLARLSWVWHLASLHHPAAAVRGVPIDSAFIRAVTLVRAANGTDALEQAYTRFLAVLDDPLSHVERGAVSASTLTDARVSAERTRDSILVLRVPTASRYDEAAAVSVRTALTDPPARVVLDLRAPSIAEPDSVEAFFARTQLVEQLASLPFTRSTVRTRRVGGMRFEANSTPAANANANANATATATATAWRFDDSWLVRDGGLLMPRASTPRRIMILANAQTVLPRGVLGLIASARGTLIGEEGVRDDALVPTVRIDIGDGLAVRLRTGELVHADGSSGLFADTLVAAAASADSAPAVRTAMTLLRAGRAPRAFRFPAVRRPATLPGYYDSDPYPFMGARVLAGARLWSAMRARHAHRDLYDDDIDAVFTRTIGKLEAAKTAVQYAAALRDLTTSFDDAQVQLSGASVDSVRGLASAPFRARMIEGRAIITDVLNDPDVKTAGLDRGVEILSVDGFPLVAWLAEHRRDVSAPNDAVRTDMLMRLMTRGPEGAMLLRVRDLNNRERQVTINRRERFVPLLPTVERPQQAASLALATGIAYLDVDRLTDQTVDAAIAQQRSVRGWIVDLRGELADSSVVGSRLLAAVRSRDVAVVARELHRYQSAPCLAESLREATQQCSDERETRARVSRGDTTGRYAGRLVALVDERTSGAMERLALALEATTDITFIGSSTAGSPTEGVEIALPGRLSVAVPAAELRRTDGSAWQRVGISPVIDARLTVRLVRSGADDVIDRAQQWLVQQLDSTRRRR